MSQRYPCPGTDRQQVNPVTSNNNCCFAAIGHALPDRDLVFGSRVRSLESRVRRIVAELVKK
jgi:hypothetical protein